MILLGFATALSHAALPGKAGSGDSPEALRLAPLFQAKRYTDHNGGALPYRYFEPQRTTRAESKYPVILYLHGEEEAGTDNRAQITRTECATVWVEPHHLASNPAFVLAPQLPKGRTWADDSAYTWTLDFLHDFIQHHPAADQNRIYIVGFSMGANGLWKLLLKNPDLFAAAMPISGSANPYLGDYQAWAALKNTPVILIHSYDDTVVPISASINAAAALQAAGNEFLGATVPCFWSPGSTSSPHDAWYVAFHKFEVVYNSLFLGDLERTQHGAISPTTLYTKRSLGDGVTQVWDYALGTSFIIERKDKAVIIDTTMGKGSLYQYIRDHVLQNKDADLEVFLTHDHRDHVLGLASFVGKPQLKKVYVHKEDSLLPAKILGPDAAKIQYVKDGDQILFDGKAIEVIGVSGHSLGSIVMKYGKYLFSGDSIGTGYVGVNTLSIEEYEQSLQHLLDKIGSRDYVIYGGHTGEQAGPLHTQYILNLQKCAREIVSGTIPGPPYWRSRDSSTRKVSTVEDASITYTIDNTYKIKAALSALRISAGILTQRYRPDASPLVAPPAAGFNPWTAYYAAAVGKSVDALDVQPVAQDSSYKSLTVNGHAITSGEAYRVQLNDGLNRIAIALTAADGFKRTYTVDVTR
jgi:glyoxylase-like metal-dependent hydrolase (beta-lactamase superfamily II)/predicted esterase